MATASGGENGKLKRVEIWLTSEKVIEAQMSDPDIVKLQLSLNDADTIWINRDNGQVIIPVRNIECIFIDSLTDQVMQSPVAPKGVPGMSLAELEQLSARIRGEKKRRDNERLKEIMGDDPSPNP